jgi:hypothetical protein
MASLSHKDRASLCQFTFADNRKCRMPRCNNHPHFCFDHARKELRAFTKSKLSRDLAYYFSGEYLSANDLSAALGRLLPAVVSGDISRHTAKLLAYLSQTLIQAIQLAQHEYVNAFGPEAWRESIRNSVNDIPNRDIPPAAPDSEFSPLDSAQAQGSTFSYCGTGTSSPARSAINFGN